MKDTKDVIACVVDHGLFLPVARRLARDFKHVRYWSPWERTFPTLKECAVGDGFEDIERIDSVWDVRGDTDLFVFPDIGFAGMQNALLENGHAVWGARYADELEVHRGMFLQSLGKTSLPIPSYRTIQGTTALEDYLKGKSDKYVKISRYRGDTETFHYRDWEQDESTLDLLAVKFGPMKESVTFYVFDPINTHIEDGVDTFCIDGMWPEHCIHGMEAKDKAFIGTFQEMAELPDEVRVVNEEFGPVLARYGYRSFFSSEVRITQDKKSFFIDPTLRCGSPPSQIMAEMFGNFSDIVWRGAHGEVVDPTHSALFGVQGLLSVAGDPRAWRAMELSDDLDQWIKCGTCMKVDPLLCFPPDHTATGNDVGWLVGLGNTIAEAIESLRENTKALPDGVTCEFSALADLLKEIDEAEEKGMEFTDQPVPPPSVVIEEK